jgi:hypothetical protein
MKTQSTSIVLIVINLVVLGLQFANAKPSQPDSVIPIVRTRAFELLDDQGRVRAELRVFPAQPKLKMPDGTVGLPEIVQLRLINSQGGPRVKLGTSEDGGGLYVGGDESYIQVLARSENPFIRIRNKEGREQIVKP